MGSGPYSRRLGDSQCQFGTFRIVVGCDVGRDRYNQTRSDMANLVWYVFLSCSLAYKPDIFPNHNLVFPLKVIQRYLSTYFNSTKL